MVGVFGLAILGVVAVMTVKTLRNFLENLDKAKKMGLPYVIGLFPPVGYVWMGLGELAGVPLGKIPWIKEWAWLDIIHFQGSWKKLRLWEEKLGDTYVLVNPLKLYLKTSNAELATQITARRIDFTKPTEGYGLVDIFGKSILTQEGQEWRRHRKIVGPGFSEKSNRLVFEESLRQTEGMMKLWATQGTNTKAELRVVNTSEDAATLSLHVICAAGFGVPQVWPNETEENLEEKGLQAFSKFKLIGGHTLSFKDALVQLLKHILWFVLFTPSMLKSSPLKVHKRTYQAFNECKMYFEELFDLKKKQIDLGESEKGTMDLMGPMIKANYEASPDDSKLGKNPSATLTKQEILGNAFIFLFAGHETTANSIHYSIIYLAIHLAKQRHLQADVDSVVGEEPTSEWSYYDDLPRLYNSMPGAVIHEELRLIPAILNVPKGTHGDQVVTLDGKQVMIPDNTFVHLNIVGTHRNPRYWPESPNEFVPERWLPSQNQSTTEKEQVVENEVNGAEGTDRASFETSGSGSLLKPVKGSYIPFSDGARACPGRRFAQVEGTAVLSAMFHKYSVELDVSEWASDEEVEKMGKEEKRRTYQKAIDKAETLIRRSEQVITVQMLPGDKVPLRFVQRGKERFNGV